MLRLMTSTLTFAVRAGRRRLLNALIEEASLDAANEEGVTISIIAVREGNEPMTKLLIDERASIHAEYGFQYCACGQHKRARWRLQRCFSSATRR